MNKKIIQYKSSTIDQKNIDKKGIISDLVGKSFGLLSVIKENNNTLRKAKGSPSATTVWNNSIYSFNKNYLKNIPVVDSVVNKLIKSFFTIEPLANNPKGRKSRLIQRRYKRLSLNRILVSKSEVKHYNDKVYITVYLFNKKRKSLMLKLRNLYKALSINKFLSPINDNIKLDSIFSSSKNLENNSSTKFAQSEKSNVSVLFKDSKISRLNNEKKLSIIPGNKIKTQKLLSDILFNEYAFVGLMSSKLNIHKTNSPKSRKFDEKNNENKYLNTVSYYKSLSSLTKYNIHLFIDSLSGREKNGDLETNLRNYFKHLNKYKLYSGNGLNNHKNLSKSNLNSYLFAPLSISYTRLIKGNLRKPNYSIYKLKSIYKLFNLYNNISNYTDLSQSGINKSIYSKKIILNSYKLLKKSYIKLSLRGFTSTLPQKVAFKNIPSGKKLVSYKTAFITQNDSNKYTLGINSQRNLRNTKSYLNLKKDMKSVVLINKLTRIEKFIDRYKNIILSSRNTAGLSINTNDTNNLIKNVISTYRLNFINELLEKELLYIYYLKLLSYNNAIFKNWFLYPLKNLISKIYNKQVVFNLVNLKYIHLNSDIFSQAVNIRLRNFRKNKLVNVLKKVIKLVPISKVNIYACDENSTIYKYIHNYHNKFRNLKLDVFKELGLLKNNVSPEQEINSNTSLHNGSLPKVRRLNYLQTSTVNFIKYKAVFGVRLETAGRLTKRSTASRSVFKYRYKGTLRSNPVISNSISSVIVKNNMNSNLQFTKIASKTRNGSFGIKGWINSN